MKTLLLDVTCLTPELPSAPDHFCIRLDDAQIEKIKTLASKAKELNTLNIQSLKGIFDGGLFFTTDAFESISPEGDLDDEFFNSLKQYQVNMEDLRIVVYPSHFQFSAIPKHHELSSKCYTNKVNVRELNNKNALHLPDGLEDTQAETYYVEFDGEHYVPNYPLQIANQTPLIKFDFEDSAYEQLIKTRNSNPHGKKWAFEDSLKAARVLWDALADIPVDKDDQTEIPFLHFPAGVEKWCIHHWFEDYFDISIAKDLENI